MIVRIEVALWRAACRFVWVKSAGRRKMETEISKMESINGRPGTPCTGGDSSNSAPDDARQALLHCFVLHLPDTVELVTYLIFNSWSPFFLMALVDSQGTTRREKPHSNLNRES